MFCVISFMEHLFYFLKCTLFWFEFLVYYFFHDLILWGYYVNKCNHDHDDVRIHVILSNLSIKNNRSDRPEN